MFDFDIVSFIPRAVMQGIPLLYGSTGEILTEKSGNLNLGIPGIMYVGGICGVIGAFFYEQAVPADQMSGFLAIMIPMLCSLLGSLLMGLLYCFLTVTLRANQNVTGLAMTTFGVGIGNSVQKHQWLPYAENDFIFVVVCEELGFIGAIALIVLFGALIVQGIAIALNAPDFFGSLLGIGIMAQVAWQVFCHIGVATALLPNTGISLPFFSYGGTSLLILLGEMGIMLSISRAGNGRREARRQREQEEMENRLRQKSTYRRRRV